MKNKLPYLLLIAVIVYAAVPYIPRAIIEPVKEFASIKEAHAEQQCPASIPDADINISASNGQNYSFHRVGTNNVDDPGEGVNYNEITVPAGTVLTYSAVTSGGTGPNRSIGRTQYTNLPVTVTGYMPGYYSGGYSMQRAGNVYGTTDALSTGGTIQVGQFNSCWSRPDQAGPEDGQVQITIQVNIAGTPTPTVQPQVPTPPSVGIYINTAHTGPGPGEYDTGESALGIVYNGSAQISWRSYNTTSCRASGGDWVNPPSSLALNETTSYPSPNGPYTYKNLKGPRTVTYTITCTGPGGTISDTARGQVDGGADPDFTCYADPYKEVNPGETAVFTVSASPLYGFNNNINVNTNSIPSGAVASQTTLGSGNYSRTIQINTGNATPGSYNFNFVFADANGVVSNKICPSELKIKPLQPTPTTASVPPSVQLYVTDTATLAQSPTGIPVPYGSQIRLTWLGDNTVGPTPCTGSNDFNVNNISLPEDETSPTAHLFGNITSPKTYTITCVGASGTQPATSTVTVNVNGQPTPTPTPVPTRIPVNPTPVPYFADIDCSNTPNSNPSAYRDGPCDVAYGTQAGHLWNSNALGCDLYKGNSGPISTNFENPPSATDTLYTSQTWTIKCYNDSGHTNLLAQDSVTFNVAGQPTIIPTATPTPELASPPIVDLKCLGNEGYYFDGPCVVNSESTGLLAWDAQNITGNNCNITGTNGLFVSVGSNGSGVTTGNLRSDATFTIQCTNNAGQRSDSVQFKVTPLNVNLQCAPTGSNSFGEGPCDIEQGQTANLRWSSNTLGCDLYVPGDKYSTTPNELSSTTAALNSSFTYVIRCYNDGSHQGPFAEDTVRINVNPPPPPGMTADIDCATTKFGGYGDGPCSIPYGTKGGLQWTSNVTQDCDLEGPYGTQSPVSKNFGPTDSDTLFADHTYVLKCFNNRNTGVYVQASVSFNVEPQPIPTPTPTPVATPTPDIPTPTPTIFNPPSNPTTPTPTTDSLNPRFVMSCTPANHYIERSGTVTYLIDISAFDGYNAAISFTASASGGLPDPTINPNPLNLNGASFATTVMTVATTSSTPVGGPNVITVTAQGGGVNRACSVNLTVDPATPPQTPVVSALSNTCEIVNVSWSSSGSPAPEYYQLFRGPASNGPWTQLGGDFSGTTYADPNANTSGSNFYSVIAYRQGSPSARGVTQAGVIPQACTPNLSGSDKDLVLVGPSGSVGSPIPTPCSGVSELYQPADGKPFRKGQTVTFKLCVSNENGNAPLTSGRVQDTPTNVAINDVTFSNVAGTPCGNWSGAFYNINTLPAGARCIVTIVGVISSTSNDRDQRFLNAGTITSNAPALTVETPPYNFTNEPPPPTRNEIAP